MDTTQTLRQIIMNLAKGDITETDINLTSTLVGDFGFDSMSIVEMIVEIETQFNIDFDDSAMDWDKFTQFGSLCDLVSAMLIARTLD